MSHVPKTFDALAEYVSQGETHDHCRHLGCILPRVPATIVRAGRVLWEGEAAGDVVHRRVRKEGEAALKRVAWKPSLHCQKPSIAIKQLVAPMHAASENPVDEIMTAARSLFAGPGAPRTFLRNGFGLRLIVAFGRAEPAKAVVSDMLSCLATWSLRYAPATAHNFCY